jgi:pimeloyl-ACP methyl ester carboxylesterase
MATFVLIHGAGSDSCYWHLVVPELESHGHEVVVPDLPCDDDRAGFEEYADVVVAAIGDRSDVVLVAQSMAGFSAPLVCARVPVERIVLVAAMVPLPGESPGDWWTNTGWEEARVAAGRGGGEFDVVDEFFHDVEPDVVAEAMARGAREQSGTPFERPWPLDAWPDVPTSFVLCTQDRFFPAPFLRRVVEDRLGVTPDDLESGHLPALSRPRELAAMLDDYVR